MATEITVITNGRVKVVKDGGTPQYFSNENHEAQVAGGGSSVAIINSARSLSPAYEIDPLDVTTPAGPWTAVTLCEWLNASPRFFKSAGGGGGGITSVDTLTPITGNGINPDPVRIGDGTVDGDTLTWNAATGFWVIDSQLVNQRLADLVSGLFERPVLQTSSSDPGSGTPVERAAHEYTSVNVGGVSQQYSIAVNKDAVSTGDVGAVMSGAAVVETPSSENLDYRFFAVLRDFLFAVAQRVDLSDGGTGLAQTRWSQDDGLGGIPPYPTLREDFTLSGQGINSAQNYRLVYPIGENGKHRFRNEFSFDRNVLSGNSIDDSAYASLEYRDGTGSAHTEGNDKTTVDEATPIAMWIDPVDAGVNPWPDGTRLSLEFTVQVASTLTANSFYVKGICFYIKNGGTGNWDEVFTHTDGTYNVQQKFTNMISDPTVYVNVTSGGDPFTLFLDPSSGSFSSEQVRVSSFVNRLVTLPL